MRQPAIRLTRAPPAPPPPPAPAAPGVFNATLNKFRASYMLNTSLMTQEDAQQFCIDNGGHLAGYDSLAEQVAVEQQFIKDVRPCWPGPPITALGLLDGLQ